MTEQGPIHLEEDAETGDRFLVYDSGKGARLDIRFEGETLWMTQEQIARLFGRDVSAISRHIANVIAEGELDEGSSLQKLQTTLGRPATVYSLDMVISVGYRVSSAQATLFRRWATGVLVQFAKSGFVVDSVRLKNQANADRIAELRDIIRDIRSDEANVYRELKRICSLCQDYDPASDRAATFFQQTQAKLIYAVVSKTPSEVLVERADHRRPDMGLASSPKDRIRKQDVSVSKNYLAEGEVRELNRLTTILLDIFEDQADLGRLVVMADATRLLEEQLRGLGRTVLRGGGTVDRCAAVEHAEREYETFNAARKQAAHDEADARIAALAKEAKGLPKSGRGQT
ncbi:MAG: virulence RhuM family protein [Mesorhizobium sp.]|nr:virulence RhuM family protein [Mesorhizobium sp.]